MRVPFPLSFTIGTDIILQSRILRLLNAEPSKLQRFTAKVLQPVEIADLSRRFPKWREAHQQSKDQRTVATWLAGRWAAKEAAKKAWGASLLSFKDLRVEPCTDTGEVQVICGIERPGSDNSVEQVAKLSISHDGDYAIAVVIATPLHLTIRSELGRRKAEAEVAIKA